MEFNENFFCKEVRSEFEVPAMVKRVWAAELEVLKVFDDICRRRGLTWFADSGTLLGAIRHKGFIPWDDDVDVCMLRPDYDRLFECIEEELPDGYFFYHPLGQPSSKFKKFSEPFGQIVNGVGINYSKDYLKKNHGCPFSVGLDIFPFSGLPEDEEEREKYVDDFFLLKDTVLYLDDEKNYQDKILEKIAAIEKRYGVQIDCLKNTKYQLMFLLEELSRKYPIEKSVDVANYYWMKKKNQKPFVMKKAWFEDAIQFPFEGMMIPCPIGYREVLTVYYKDYMTPVKGGGAHEYPFPFCESMYHLAFADETPDCKKREKEFAEKLHVELYEIKELGLRKSTTLAKYYQYFYDGEYYIHRIPFDKEYSFLDWERERSVYEALRGTDIVLSPVFMEQDGTKAVRFISDASFLDKDDAEQVADSLMLLKAFHQMSYTGKKGASPVDMLRFYESKYEAILLAQRDILGLNDHIKDAIARWESYPSHDGLAHMNLTTRSFIQSAKEEQKELLLLDLKYAGAGDADWDLAGLAAELFCGEEEIFDLLVLYFGDSMSQEEYMVIYEKILFGTCIVSFVRGIQYRLLSENRQEYRKQAFRYLKTARKLIDFLRQKHLLHSPESEE